MTSTKDYSLSRRTFLAGSLGAGAAGLIGLPGARAQDAPLAAPAVQGVPSGEVTIWNRSGDLFKVFDAALNSFRAKYPDVTVNHLQVDVDAKLPNSLITGTEVPDGSFCDDSRVPAFAENLADLTDLVAPYLDKVAKPKLEISTIGGRNFGVPWDLDPGLLFYREDVLAEAGADVAELSSYDGMLGVARKIKAARPDAKPIHFDEEPFLGQMWLEMLASQQGTSMADASGQLRLDSEEYRRIFGWIRSVADEGLATRAKYLQPGDIATLESGQQSLVPWAIWFNYAPELLLKDSKGKWRATLLPAWTDGGARSGTMGGSSFVIPKQAKNPYLAWLVFEHLCFSDEGVSSVYGPNEIYPGGINTSIPSYLPALDPAKPLFKPGEGLGGQNLWEVAVDAGKQIPGATPLPVWWGQAVDYLGANLQRLMNAEISVDEIISRSSEDIQRNLIDRM